MTNNLKPCPFCGGAATLEDQRLMWAARCGACGACVLGDRAPEPEQELPESYWAPFRQSAVDRWNRRPAAPPAPKTQPAPPAPEPRLLWSWKTRSDGTPPVPEPGGLVIDIGTGDTSARVVLDRWGPTPTPPAAEVGEVGELVAWLHDHALNCRELGQIDWAAQVTSAADLLQQLSAPAPAVVPVAVEALTRLYWWGGMSGSYGYSADVVLSVRDWINGGMAGDLPPLPPWIADRCPLLPQAGEVEA